MSRQKKWAIGLVLIASILLIFDRTTEVSSTGSTTLEVEFILREESGTPLRQVDLEIYELDKPGQECISLKTDDQGRAVRTAYSRSLTVVSSGLGLTRTERIDYPDWKFCVRSGELESGTNHIRSLISHNSTQRISKGVRRLYLPIKFTILEPKRNR